MTNEPKHPPADMAGLDDLIWRIKERMPIDHTEMLALAARVKVLEAENERLIKAGDGDVGLIHWQGERIDALEAENERLREVLGQVELIVEDEGYKVTAGQPLCRHVSALNEIHEEVSAALKGTEQ